MTYLLDKEREEARKRLALLARIQDPGTLACLERTGVGPGFRCLEVGAGSGTVAVWLRDRVAPGGSVVASDLDTTFLEPLAGGALEVRRHDVVADGLEEEEFDLVHARNLLVHLPEREAVVEKLARAVKPGGWMLLEELDRVTDAADPTVPEAMQSLYGKVVGEIYAFAESKGLDPTFGSRLFGALRRVGFRELQAEGRVFMFRGHPGEPVSPHVPAFVELKDAIVARGNVTAEEFEGFIALTRSPDFAWREGLLVAAWGRKPSRP